MIMVALGVTVPAMYPGTFAQRTPGKPAVIVADTGQVMTYGELDEHSARLARVLHPPEGFRKLGLSKPGLSKLTAGSKGP